MAGNHVLMVSGSDQHGTPVTVRADKEGRTPQEVVDQFHPEFLRYWQRAGHLVRSLHDDRHEEPRGGHARLLPAGCWSKGYIYKGIDAAVLRPAGRALPARPLRRGHLPALRLREGARRPVRQLRPHARPRAAHQPAQPHHRRDAGDARHRALLLQAERVPGAAARVAAHARRAGASTCRTSASAASRRGCTTARSRATSSGACRSRSRTWARASASTSGSRRSSATSRRRRSGRSCSGDARGVARLVGGPGGADATTSSARTTSLPHDHLAGDADGVRRPEPADGRAGEPVRHLQGREGVEERGRRRVGADVPRALPAGRDPLLRSRPTCPRRPTPT